MGSLPHPRLGRVTESRLHLVLCHVFQPETLALPRALFEHVTFTYFEDRCGAPSQEWADPAELIAGCEGCSRGTVIGTTSCLRAVEVAAAAPYPVDTVKLQQCFHLVAPRSVVEREQRDGAYCVTPGWLADWRGKLDRWGFDRETAVAFFGENVRRVVLLDTLRDDASRRNLEEFATAVALPFGVVDVGLAHFEATLTSIVRARTPSRSAAADAVERRSAHADYALALDLLGTLFHEARSHADAFDGIMDAAQMLFAPTYVSVLERREDGAALLHAQGEPVRPVAPDEAQRLFARCAGSFVLAEDGAGFSFRIALGDTVIGLVEVRGVANPASVPQYINLALSIAPVCAAAVSSARDHEEVRTAGALLETAIADLKGANDDLTMAKRELQQLLQVLPVCAWCKKIMDEEGAWTKLAELVASYTGAHFSHGICPACAAQVRSGLRSGNRPVTDPAR